MVYFEQYIVFPPETQGRVDSLIRLMRCLVIIGTLLLVLTVILAAVGLGIGYLLWKEDADREGRVACRCGGQEIKKTK